MEVPRGKLLIHSRSVAVSGSFGMVTRGKCGVLKREGAWKSGRQEIEYDYSTVYVPDSGLHAVDNAGRKREKLSVNVGDAHFGGEKATVNQKPKSSCS